MTYQEAQSDFQSKGEYVHENELFVPVIVPTVFDDYKNFLAALQRGETPNVQEYSLNNDFAVIGLMKKGYSNL
jgi:hypothetical protein